ncbi:hypothetical protein ASZ90_019107 [hydrocarbon metagenome]|uniref:Uncharacterized protein n=1 Tax=hydrocarbon metagenome TaxID=938273 RepID=A0A0W8E493_9ZZZZ
MRLLRLENFRHIDRNKAGGDAYLEYGQQVIKAELIFYLQGSDCLNIRLGRHDTVITTSELEEFLKECKSDLRKQIRPDVERIRKERKENMESTQA